jgi:hypothetical protein
VSSHRLEDHQQQHPPQELPNEHTKTSEETPLSLFGL